MNTGRTYLCIDLKSFYASVECVARGLDPLTARLVVADESRTDKTICLAVSPALKAFGIPGRARLFEVKQRLEAVRRETGRKIDFVAAVPRMAFYIDVSSKIYQVYLKYVAPEDIHVYSIDEVFMDITDYLKLYRTDAHSFAVTMIRDVLSATGITATAGIAPNLYLAKVAMDIVAKHVPADKDGVRVASLDEESYRTLLWNHRPVTDFWRIGRGLAAKLAEYGCETMGDIARMSLENEEQLYRIFGIDAEIMIDHAWGIEPCGMKEIKAYRPSATSSGSGQVLPCPYPFEKARLILREMTDMLVLDLVEKRLVTDSVTIQISYNALNVQKNADTVKEDTRLHRDYYGRTAPKAAHGTVSFGTHTSSGSRILDEVTALYDRIVNPKLTVHAVYVTANNLLPEEEAAYQLDLFTDQKALEKEKRLQHAMIDIKKRYGKNAVLRGMNLEDGATAAQRNDQIGGHKA